MDGLFSCLETPGQLDTPPTGEAIPHTTVSTQSPSEARQTPGPEPQPLHEPRTPSVNAERQTTNTHQLTTVKHTSTSEHHQTRRNAIVSPSNFTLSL